MAEKKSGGSKATTMAEGNVKLGEIETAAASTMADRSYKEGYPIQKGAIFQGGLVSRGGRKGGRE